MERSWWVPTTKICGEWEVARKGAGNVRYVGDGVLLGEKVKHGKEVLPEPNLAEATGKLDRLRMRGMVRMRVRQLARTSVSDRQTEVQRDCLLAD